MTAGTSAAVFVTKDGQERGGEEGGEIMVAFSAWDAKLYLLSGLRHSSALHREAG